MTDLEPLWKVMDVAKYLNTSRTWVYQQAEAGKLPSLKIGGLLRFQPETIRAWVQQRSEGSNGKTKAPA